MSFRNPHYFPAGATLFGSEAGGAYEYEGQAYNGRFRHVSSFDTCISCHETHALEALEEACGTCHAGIEGVEDTRTTEGDFDCDGDAGGPADLVDLGLWASGLGTGCANCPPTP